MRKQRYFIVSILVIIIDQLSKFYIRSNMELGETIKLSEKFIWITHVANTGAAFSISLGSIEINRIIFSVVTILAIFILVILIMRSQKGIERFGFSLILGGAAGNLIDRIWHGQVTDFVNCDFPNFIMERWPVFNVADSAVVVGVLLLGIYYLFLENREKEIFEK